MRRAKTPLANQRSLGAPEAVNQVAVPIQANRHHLKSILIGGGTVAAVMVSSLAVLFLAPLLVVRVVTDPHPLSGGRILGESVTVPLQVPVTVRLGNQQWSMTTTPHSGTVVEALSQVAAANHQTFSYTSRGQAIYLQSFFNVSDDVSGSWIVSVNGLPVTDLSSINLEQGDEIVAERQTP